MVRPWDEWLIVWGYDINEPPPEVDEEFATEVAHELIGDDTIAVDDPLDLAVVEQQAWAARYADGRVFCMGDACHRHPPSNGLGSNTSIQDAYNLAWKLALVLRGKAAPSLLDSYDAERAPIGKQIVTAREPEHRGVRADLRGARRPRDARPRADAAQHRGAQGRHAAGRRAAGEAPRGDRAQELRVQRPRRRAGPSLPLRGGRARRHARAGLRPRPRALLPPDDVARRAPAARVGRAPGREDRRRRGEGRGLDPRPRGQGPLHASSPASAATRGPRPPPA